MIDSVCTIPRVFAITVLLVATVTAISAQQDGEVRIVGGGTVTSGGRVEVYIGADSQWSTICDDDHWDIRDADVVCRQLGYPRAIAAVSDSNIFGMGEGRILLSDVNCSGIELTILSCPRQSSDITVNCNHMEDVGVYCFGTVKAPVTLNGRFVNISYGGESFPICENGWDEVAANVTCRQLGFIGARTHFIITPVVGTVTLAWLHDGIRCNGDETALSYCIDGFFRQNCPDNRYAGVTCYTERITTPQHIGARVVNGASDGSSGRLEVWYNSQWGNVCKSGWKYSNALVTCRQLGYSSAVMLEPNSPPSFGVDLENKPIHFTSVDCTGLEFNIGECQWSVMTDTCTSSNAVGISCTQATSNPLMEFQLQLIDANGIVTLPITTTSTVTANGRLEVFYNGHWGTVCSDGFTVQSGEVACKQLGYERYIGAPSAIVTPSAKGPIWMSNVMCSSTDTSLDQCPFAGWGVNRCNHSTDVHIECEGIVAFSKVCVVCVCTSPHTHTHTQRKCSGLVAYTLKYINSSFFPFLYPIFLGRLNQVGGNCGPAPQVDHSSNIHSGQQVTYSCVRGYDLIGSSVINCLPSGVWSPDPPMCNGTDCGPPPAIENGYDPEYLTTGVGATAIYRCLPGYRIENNNHLICNERRMWVVTPPECNDINECGNTTTNNCTMNVELCVNGMGSYECCNALLRDCQIRAGVLTPPLNDDSGLSSTQQTVVIICGIILLLITVVVAAFIIVIVNKCSPAKRASRKENQSKRDNQSRGHKDITMQRNPTYITMEDASVTNNAYLMNDLYMTIDDNFIATMNDEYVTMDDPDYVTMY
ncbi:scavenger receptor cysteine-rich domain-containing group B protein-like isoform X1 [Dysidea avara]|uniref:scavenger receptor cysteine-rich domain-containing group B protein-like isoform X1 n=1 Tax=Dysidea avara TaxID=196820 RepID=UPI003316C446